MPIVRIQLAEGRSAKEKTVLMKAVTDAIQGAIDVPLETIHVMIQDIPPDDIMVGGETLGTTPPKSRI